MNFYEIVVLGNTQKKPDITQLLDNCKAVLSEGCGTVDREEDWGSMPLAYRIGEHTHAHFTLLNISSPTTATIEKIKHLLKLSISVIRHLIVKQKQTYTADSVMLQRLRKEREGEKAKVASTEAKTDDTASSGEAKHQSANRNTRGQETAKVQLPVPAEETPPAKDSSSDPPPSFGGDGDSTPAHDIPENPESSTEG